MKIVSFFISLLLVSSCINQAPRLRSGNDEKDPKQQQNAAEFAFVSSIPESGSTGISKTADIVLNFNKPLLNEGLYTINLETTAVIFPWSVVIRDQQSNPVFVKALGQGSSLSADGKTLTLKLVGKLKDQAKYRITIHEQLRANNESKTALGKLVEIDFTTVDEAPVIDGYTYSTDPGQEVAVTFSKPMKSSSVVTNKADNSCSMKVATGVTDDTGAMTYKVMRGIHVSCDGGKTCLPMSYVEPNGDDTVFRLKPQSSFPFNKSCKIMVFATDMVDQTNANEGQGAKLQAPGESPSFKIEGFTISGRLLYQRIPIINDRLSIDSAVNQSTPPLEVVLMDTTASNQTQTVNCTYGASGCSYRFSNLQKGYFKLAVNMRVLESNIAVYDPEGYLYSYKEDLAEIEANTTHDLLFLDNDINQNGAIDGHARPIAILDTLWQLYQLVFAGDSGSKFWTDIYWSSQNIEVSAPQVDLRSHLLPGTFVRWKPASPVEKGELYLLGNRQVDSDEYDEAVIVREWLRLYLDKKMRVDAKIRRGAFGMGLDPRVALYEGLLSGLTAAILGDSYYRDSGGSAVGINGVGWSLDFAQKWDLPLWVSHEEIARLLYHFSTADSGYLPAFLQALGTLNGSASFNTIYTFLGGLGSLLTSDQQFNMIAAEEDYGLDFTGAFEGSNGMGETHLYGTREPIINVQLNSEPRVIKMGSYGHPSLLGAAYSSAFIRFNGNGQELTFAVSDSNIIIDIYKMTTSGPYFQYSNLGTGSNSVIFKSQSGALYYLAVLTAMEAEEPIYPKDILPLRDISTQITFVPVSSATTQEDEAEREHLVSSYRDFSVGKASLPGDITFSHKEGSNKITVHLPAIMSGLDDFDVKVIGIDGVELEAFSSSTYFSFKEFSFTGREGYIVVTVGGKFDEKGKRRTRSTAYAL